jgi:glycerate 2-kinase
VSESPAEVARLILLAGIRAVNPRHLTATALASWTAGIEIRTVDVIAVGKAATEMMLGAGDALGRGVRSGIVISPETAQRLPDGVVAFTGGHPMPNDESERGARAVATLLCEPNRGRRTLVLISGGASALMTLPPKGISLDDVIATSRAMMNAGADIRELNCVRKHLDQLKGGRMARLAGGAPLRALVLSDVIGDPLDVIGSGPLVADPTTFGDAIDMLKRRGVWAALPGSVSEHLLAGARGEVQDTPKTGDPCFARVDIEVIGNNALAVQGAAVEARRRGYFVEVIDTPIAGEAREAGAAFVRRALELAELKGRSRHICLVGGGETTVTVTGSGIGGRNLEFAAAAALAIDGMRGITVGSVGTDGRDGPTDAAGAIVDGGTAARARDARMDLAGSLHDNDTLRVLDATGAVLRTGATGTNVMDVCVATLTPPKLSEVSALRAG